MPVSRAQVMQGQVEPFLQQQSYKGVQSVRVVVLIERQVQPFLQHIVAGSHGCKAGCMTLGHQH